MRSLLIALGVSAAVTFVGQATASDWPDSLRDGVFDGCMLDAPEQGISKEDIVKFCLCFTISVENEWPLRQFGEVLAALEEPHDSPSNQKLAGIVQGCRP